MGTSQRAVMLWLGR